MQKNMLGVILCAALALTENAYVDYGSKQLVTLHVQDDDAVAFGTYSDWKMAVGKRDGGSIAMMFGDTLSVGIMDEHGISWDNGAEWFSSNPISYFYEYEWSYDYDGYDYGEYLSLGYEWW